MEQEQIKNIEERLLKMKEGILSNLMSENEDFQALIDDSGVKDLADLASDDIDVMMLEALGQQELKRLRMVEAALGRIMNERYGLCIKCNKRITASRLEAIPYAPLCIDCQSLSEKRKR